MRARRSASARESTSISGDELDAVIGELVGELVTAIEQVGSHGRALVAAGRARSAISRSIAVQVLAGWLRANRHRLSDPSDADRASELITSALHTTAGSDHVVRDIDVSITSQAAGRLASALGDEFPMAIVWIAAGLDAQLA